MLLPLVTISLRLEGALNIDAYILGLFRRKFGELGANFLQMERRHFFIEVFGQNVDLFLILIGVSPQLDLGQHLVCE